MTSPRFSVVVPSLNRAAWIGECVRSVLATTTSVEVIVADGGSVDGTLDVLRQLAGQDQRLSYFSDRDTGMYDAINRGLARARGDILSYLNTDDRYLPWTFDAVCEAMEDPSVDAVFGDLLVTTTSGRSEVYIYPRQTLGWLPTGAVLAQPTVFLRRATWLRVGAFDQKLELLGDAEYWLRSLELGCNWRRIRELLAVEINHSSTLRQLRPDAVRRESQLLSARYSGSSVTRLRAARLVLARKLELLLFALAFRMPSAAYQRSAHGLRERGVRISPRRLMWALLPGRRPDVLEGWSAGRFE